MPNSLISDIIQMYSDTSDYVLTELGPAEWLKTTSGVLQCDALSLYLFIVLLDYALKKTLQDYVGFVVRKRNMKINLENKLALGEAFLRLTIFTFLIN